MMTNMAMPSLRCIQKTALGLVCLVGMMAMMNTGCSLFSHDDNAGGNACGSTAPALDADGSDAVTTTADYLFSVFLQPTGASAQGVPYPVTLTVPESATRGNALRVVDRVQHMHRAITRGDGPDQQSDRLRYESRRRAAMDQLIEAMRAGDRSVEPQTDGPGRDVGGAACACTATQMCWKGACVSTGISVAFPERDTAVTCDLVQVVQQGNVVLNVLLDRDLNTPTNRTAVVHVAENFASTLPTEWQILNQDGHTGVMDHDGDGRLTLIFTNAVSTNIPVSVVGFFDFRDFLPTGNGSEPVETRATGNEADVLWLRMPGTNQITDVTASGTLAHEYTHLVSYARRVQARGANAQREVLWLDEGIAHTMEDLTGWGPSNVNNVAVALEAWAEGPFAGPDDTNAQRGRAYLLLRHIIDGRARDCADTAASDAVIAEARLVIGGLIDEASRGYQHTVFQNLGADGVWEWLMGVYATGNAAVTFAPAHRFDYLAMGTSAITGHRMGINPRGSVVNDVGTTLSLSGPATEDVDPGTALEGDVYDSGNVFARVTNYDAQRASQVTLTSENGGVALTLRRQRIR